MSDKPGLIWVPWVMAEHTEESSREYNKFMDDYRNKHLECPKCGCKTHTSTLVGYILVRGKEDEYKNLNTCHCSKCGDKHTFHERVNKQRSRNDSIDDIVQ